MKWQVAANRQVTWVQLRCDTSERWKEQKSFKKLEKYGQRATRIWRKKETEENENERKRKGIQGTDRKMETREQREREIIQTEKVKKKEGERAK